MALKLLKKTMLILLLIIVWILHPLLWQLFVNSSKLSPQSKNIKVVAHRGASTLAPENTLAAIQKALDLGVDIIEIDVHLTKDDQLIIIHDEVLDRTTNGTGKISDYTLEELKTLDAGSWFSKDFKGEQLPTLAEALNLINKKATCLIELKWHNKKPYTGLEEKVVNEILVRNAVDWTIVQSFESSYLEQINQNHPEIYLTKLLIGSWQFPIPFYYDTKLHWGAYSPPSYIKQVNFYSKRATPLFIKQLQSQGIKVGVFTPNSKNEIIKQGNMGVDCIITNEVKIAQQIIKLLK